MMHLGSKKYPLENEYDQFITRSGGFHNAWTESNCTAFYFWARTQCFDGALDRFSQLFQAPLLLKEAMTRERNAVESEFLLYLMLDSRRRGYLLLYSMGQPTHPASLFGCGNLKTLKENIDDDRLHQKVNDFYKRHYSTHRMYVCLKAQLSLDELQV